MKHAKMIALAASSLALTGQALAVTVFQGTDMGTAFGDPRPNANQAASDFDTIASSLNSISSITWENQVVGSHPPLNPAPGVTLTQTNGSGTAISDINSTDTGYNTTFAGSKFLQILPEFNELASVTTFTFAGGVSSFGFYITGLQSDYPGNVSVRFTDSMGNLQNIAVDKPAPVGGKAATTFFGFTDAQNSMITNVQIWNVGNRTGSRDVYGIDDVRFTNCSAVPEPATMGVLAVGLVAIARKRRR